MIDSFKRELKPLTFEFENGGEDRPLIYGIHSEANEGQTIVNILEKIMKDVMFDILVGAKQLPKFASDIITELKQLYQNHINQNLIEPPLPFITYMLTFTPSFFRSFYDIKSKEFKRREVTYCYFWQSLLKQAHHRTHTTAKEERYTVMQTKITGKDTAIQLNFKSGGMKFHSNDTRETIETLPGMQINIPNGVGFKLNTI